MITFVEPAVAVARSCVGVPQLEAGGHDDGADLELDDLVLLLEVDGARARRPCTHGCLHLPFESVRHFSGSMVARSGTACGNGM